METWAVTALGDSSWGWEAGSLLLTATAPVWMCLQSDKVDVWEAAAPEYLQVGTGSHHQKPLQIIDC